MVGNNPELKEMTKKISSPFNIFNIPQIINPEKLTMLS